MLNSPTIAQQEAPSPPRDATASGGRAVRVLHIYRRFHPDYTGEGIYYTRLIPYLREYGSVHEVLAFESLSGSGEADVLHAGLRIHYLGKRGDEGSRARLLGWLAVHIWRFDVVHLHSHVDRLFLTYALARLSGRRVVFSCTLDDSPTQLLQDYRPRNRVFARMLMRSINTFVVISPQLLRLSMQTMPEQRLSFIPQGIALDPPPDGQDRAAARQALGFGEDELVLLNVGSVSRRKNIGFLVDVLARIDVPQVRLVVVGPLLEDDYSAEIQAKIFQAGLQDRVEFVGFQDDPGRYYKAADVLVFASTLEGFPNVYLEAMASSLPIVTLFLPGLTDFIIDHGRSGMLAGDLDQFVAAVHSLRTDASLRRRMGLASRGFAVRNLGMPSVAQRYVALYRGDKAGVSEGRGQEGSADLRIRFSTMLAKGPAAIGLTEFDTPTDWPPMLQVVIDTEADFDWNKGISTDVGRVSSIVGLERGFDAFQRHGLRPSLMIDHPVATQPHSSALVRRLADQGCEVGVHLHAWTTPPLVEPRDDWHSFSGNLGASLEHAKLAALTARVEDLIGTRARAFKGGRYGISANTIAAIDALGFDIDLSICPCYDYSPLGGSDFSRFTSRPGWFGASGRLLSLPTTATRLGWLEGRKPAAGWGARGNWAGGLRISRLAARLNASYPRRLSPEGGSFAEMRRLTMQLHAAGLRIFTLSLHSPTFQVGNTPYCRSPEELAALLANIDRYLTFFRSELGGVFTTPSEIYARLAATRAPPKQA